MQIRHDQNLTLRASASLFQTMSVLQMTSQELAEYISQQLEENPALDIEASEGISKLLSGEPPSRSEPRGEREPGESSDTLRHTLEDTVRAPEGETLTEHLLGQLADLNLDGRRRQLCAFLARCVDERGYLSETEAEITELLGAEPTLVEDCFRILRSLKPAGVCAADLKACLLAQLDGERDALAARIVLSQLDALSKGHYSGIARSLHAGLSEVYAAERRIKQLEPLPARGFTAGEEVRYLYPDAAVTVTDGEPEVELCRSFLPYLRVSSYYSELLRSTDDEAVRDYLSKSISDAGALIRNVSQRESTLAKCLRTVVDIQRSVFVDGAKPVPMSIEDVSARMGVNKSTVSRAVRGKYLQCNTGVLPLRDLFSRQLSAGGDASQADARDAVARLIRGEDASLPLSDEQLCALLGREGIEISRRTVAKYRQSLGIPSSYIRARGKK